MASYDGENIKWADRHVQTDNVRIGRLVYNAGGICGPRTQRYYQVVLLQSGTLNLKVNDKNRKVVVGEPFLLLPGKSEHFIFSETSETHHSWCSVSPEIVPSELKSRLDDAPLSSDNSDVFERLLNVVFAMDPGRSPVSPMFVDTIGLAILWGYLEAATAQENRHKVDQRVARTTEYMELHFQDPDCLEMARKCSGLSSNGLIEKFKEFEGTTPSRYLWRLRTEKGISMLSDTGLSISEIAFRCGFNSPYHFSSKVSALQGVPPRELRHRVWSKRES